jgi:phytoene synthase
MSAEACEALIREHDPDRWATARLAGPLAPRLFALYAFNLEVARIPSVVSEPMLGEIRLQWWRDALEEIHDGKPPRRHEVVEPLAAAIREAGLPKDLFEALLDARSYDIHGPAIGDRPLFDAWIDGTAASLMRLAARALGANAAEDQAAREAGWAAGVGALLRALPALYARGGDPLPTPEPPDRNAMAEGETPEAVRETLRPIAEEALRRLSRARRTAIRPEVRPAFLTGWTTELLIRAAARPGYDMHGQPAPSEFRRRGGLALRVLLGRI